MKVSIGDSRKSSYEGSFVTSAFGFGLAAAHTESRKPVSMIRPDQHGAAPSQDSVWLCVVDLSSTLLLPVLRYW